ncbi:MAG: DUF4345 domain-containing protein [Hyphomicrobiales bacterium]
MLAFRITVAVLALIPISAGAAGVVYGLSFPGFDVSVANPDSQSHFRFLSGIFLAMGLAYWSVALEIGNWLQRFQLLATVTFIGGLARLVSLASDSAPSIGHQIGLGMELIAVPLFLFWSVHLRRSHLCER